MNFHDDDDDDDADRPVDLLMVKRSNDDNDDQASIHSLSSSPSLSFQNGNHHRSFQQVYRLLLDGDAAVPSTNNPEENHNAPPPKNPMPIGAVANLCSATLGAGVLALPQAMYQAGIVCGILLLTLAGISTYYSIELLTRTTSYYQYYSYESLAEHILSKRYRTLVETSMLAFCLGCAIAYMIAVGDILDQAGLLIYHSRCISMMVVWSVMMMPLSLLKSMRSIAGVSAMGVSAIGTLVFAAAVHALTTAHSSHAELTRFLYPANGFLSVLTACPVFLFAFSCQPNVTAIFHEMEAPTEHLKQENMKAVGFSSVSLCGALYSSISMIVLADFGSKVLPNMLSNYTDGLAVMKVATAAMALAVVLAYPLNIFPARVTLMGLLEGTYPQQQPQANVHLTEALLQDQVEEQRNGTNQQQQEEETGEIQTQVDGGQRNNGVPEFHLQQHIVITLFLTGTSLAMAIIIPDIKVMFGILGGTASSVIGFCIPGLLGIELCKDLKRETGKTQWHSLIVSWTLLVGGGVVGFITTVATIYELVGQHS